MQKITLPIALLSAVLTSGCIFDTSSDGEPTSAASIRTSDISLSSPDPLTQEEFLSELNSIDEFVIKDDSFVFFTNDANNADDMDLCMKNELGNKKFTSGSTKGARLDIEVPVQNCFGDLFAGATLTSTTLSILVDNLVLTDASGNEVSLIGNTISNAIGLKLKEGNLRMWMQIKGNITSGQQTVSFTASGVFSQNNKSDINQACNYESPINNCRIASIIKTSGSGNGESFSSEEGYVLTANNLYYTPGDTYFYNGTMDFQVNDWSGIMQYGSTGTTIPTFDANNGTQYITDMSYDTSANGKPAGKPATSTNKQTSGLVAAFARSFTTAVNKAIH
ncbi:MAG: hypothetical protein R3240_09075 [Gammaproteobacteria bacterium]|nr:hypothetical protein [Gammaproteobacteria bacterium]